jgi:hypothetical protein
MPHRTGRPGRNLLVPALCALLCLAAGAVRAGPNDDPWARSELHLKIIMRALTYEQHLRSDRSDSLMVGVLFEPHRSASVEDASKIIEALESQANKMTFRKRNIVVVGIPLARGKRLSDALPDDLRVLYVSEAVPEGRLAEVVAATRGRSVISVTGIEAYVRKGITLGAILRKGRPLLMVNYASALAEGASFSTQLLQLAEVIGREDKNEKDE